MKLSIAILLAALTLPAFSQQAAPEIEAADDDTTAAVALTNARGKLVGRFQDVSSTETQALLAVIQARQAELAPKAQRLQLQLNELHRAEQECQFLLESQAKRKPKSGQKGL